MAKADYKLCDVCGNKHFYDSNISDERYWNEGIVLSICAECAETHEIIIKEKEVNK